MKTVLELALEALERCTKHDDRDYDAVTALEEAIAKQGEPVAWMQSNHLSKLINNHCDAESMLARCSSRQLQPDYKALYTSAPTIPEGWQLVPKELPHKIVLDLWRDGHVEPAFTWTATLNKLSKAMLSAAPKGV
jgi:hypothetical protein